MCQKAAGEAARGQLKATAELLAQVSVLLLATACSVVLQSS